MVNEKPHARGRGYLLSFCSFDRSLAKYGIRTCYEYTRSYAIISMIWRYERLMDVFSRSVPCERGLLQADHTRYNKRSAHNLYQRNQMNCQERRQLSPRRGVSLRTPHRSNQYLQCTGR